MLYRDGEYNKIELLNSSFRIYRVFINVFGFEKWFYFVYKLLYVIKFFGVWEVKSICRS